ncbi:MAG: hypothetical protein K2G55_01830 [Lachnospiraceae bacterium]|nr:hypothetical protein [Lachnospiraceae bacterium]
METLERMYKDSRILFQKGEYYNCCYLCGYILECAIKYILQTYGKKRDGQSYTVNDLKAFRHNTVKLNQALDDWLSVTGGISPAYRLDCRRKCPYIFVGIGGYPHWNPEYRYGDHIKWYEKEYCEKYMEESKYIFQFVANIVTGGVR